MLEMEATWALWHNERIHIQSTWVSVSCDYDDDDDDSAGDWDSEDFDYCDNSDSFDYLDDSDSNGFDLDDCWVDSVGSCDDVNSEGDVD